MNIHKTVSKFLEPGAFIVSPGGVMVRHRDNVTFLKNKLKSNGLFDIRVSYFDGKRSFSEEELKSVIVVGECNDRNLVFSTLEKLHANGPFTRLVSSFLTYTHRIFAL
jgi:hypothetical protein